MERTSGRKCAELRKGNLFCVVSLEVLSNLSNNKILLANPQTLSPLFDVPSSEMFDDCQQERFAIHDGRTIRDGTVQSRESIKELAVGNDSSTEVWQNFPIRYLQGELREHLRIETKGAVNISTLSCGFARVGFAPIDEEDLSRGCPVQRTLIGVLLYALFNQGYDEVFVLMSCKAVFDVMRMDDFTIIRSPQSVNPNPLCRLWHSQTEPQQGLAP